MTAGVGTWTRYFALASAFAMVAHQVSPLVGAAVRTRAILGLFGAVLPMIFGMGYLLIPSYVGRTLATPRLPGVHFFLTYLGVWLLLAADLFDPSPVVVPLGVISWAGGIVLFVTALGYTVIPALWRNPAIVLRSQNRPQRTTRAATGFIPLAIAYLLVGTIATIILIDGVTAPVGSGFATAVHFYTMGVGTLLIFALGIRLLTGFFHVVPPKISSWVVLGSGGVAPLLLAPNLWLSPWFEIGGFLSLIAMGGYTIIVSLVWHRTPSRRVGLYGILFGAIAGLAGVAIPVWIVLEPGVADIIFVHATLLLDGFFLLTIMGYAYQFFPVTSSRFVGATDRTVLGTMGCLAIGVGLRAIGTIAAYPLARNSGIVLAIAGTTGYAYLLTRRFVGSAKGTST
jgi:hypothetical protein